MKEAFEKRILTGNISIVLEKHLPTWTADKNVLIQNIISITTNYAAQGYRLTLRQLYYQLVAADAIPNHDKVYKKIGTILDDCRYSGIEDRLVKMFVHGSCLNPDIAYDWRKDDDSAEDEIRDVVDELCPDMRMDDDDAGEKWDDCTRTAWVRKFFKVIPIWFEDGSNQAIQTTT